MIKTTLIISILIIQIKYFLTITEDQKVIRGRLKETIQNTFNRDHLLRVKIEKSADEIPWIIPIEKQGSHMLTSLTAADGFILIEANKTLTAEDIVEVNLF